ncbi:hypothetical protein TIFTF001_010905 [Ficus carica]|uniref:Uncharacterized protein n=1 Tax=Ficus carica TaxID=3494 RepID=A0AA87ZSI3_FICCA|nr:hypothetical protein TIFTF001_010905 [Ficus carica]
MIELEKVESPTTGIVHEAFEAATTAISSKIGEACTVWRLGSSSRTSSHQRRRSRPLFLHPDWKSFAISSRCWTSRSDQDAIDLACLRTLTICSYCHRIIRSPELLQSPTWKKTTFLGAKKEFYFQ